MPTDKQIAANRANALKSTGPRTPAGKFGSSRNALKHGLHSGLILAFSESRRTFNKHARALRAHFAPADPMESLLVDRIIAASWRLRRTTLVEMNLIGQRRDEIKFDYAEADDKLAEIFRHTPDLDRLPPLEAHLERSLFKSLEQLNRLRGQKSRNEPDSISTQPAAPPQDLPEPEAA